MKRIWVKLRDIIAFDFRKGFRFTSISEMVLIVIRIHRELTWRLIQALKLRRITILIIFLFDC